MIEVFGHFIRSVEMLKQGKTPFQRFLAVLCAGAMLYSMMPAQVFAEDLETGKNQTTAVTEQAPEVTPVTSPEVAPAASPAESQESTQAPATESDPVPAPVMPLADPVSSIELDQTTLELKIGDSTTLAATVTPDTATDAVTWQSGDDQVVTVTPDAGDSRMADIVAAGTGTTTITATCGGQQATCTVTVKGPATAVTIQNLNDSNTVGITPQEHEFQLMATTEPAADFCTDKIQWSVSANGENITIDPDTGSLVVNGLTQDSCQVDVTATAGSASNTLTLTVQKTADGLDIADSVEMMYGSSYDLPANSTCGVQASYTLKDGIDGGTGATINGNQITGITSVGTFTVVGETPGSAYYTAVQKEFTVTVTQKKLTPVFDGSNITIEKFSDGTLDLDASGETTNKDKLKSGFSIDPAQTYEGVELQVNVDGVQFNDLKVGTQNIDLSAVTFALVGNSANNYTLSTTQGSGTISGTIKANEPGRFEKEIEMDGRFSDAKVHNGAASFKVGTYNFWNIKHWYSEKGVPVDLKNGCELYAVNGDGSTGDSVVSEPDTDGVRYYTAPSGNQFYLNDNGVFYGPYTIEYSVDGAGPQITLKKVTANVANGGVIFGKEVTYEFEIADEGCGVDTDSVYYIVSKQEPSDADAWVHVDNVTSDDGVASFEITTPVSGTLYVKAQDQQGEETIETFMPLVVEQNAPSLTVNVTSADQGAQKDFALEIVAEEPKNNQTAAEGSIDSIPTQSGIQMVSYTIEDAEGKQVASGNLYSYTEGNLPNDLSDLDNYQTKTWNNESLAKLLESNSPNGEFKLTMTAYDFCGNASNVYTNTFVLDNTAPTVTVTMNDGQTFENDKNYYYNASNCGITVVFEDDHLDAGACDVQLFNGESLVAGKDKATVADEGSRVTVTFAADTVKALDDGTIIVKISAADTAGNMKNAFAGEGNTGVTLNEDRTEASFVLDTTAPVLQSVDMTENGHYYEGDGIYYNQNFSVALKVEEANYYKKGVQDISKRTNDGPDVTMTAPEASDNGTITIELGVSGSAENAIYNLGISLQDKAGNDIVLSTDPNSTFKDASAVTVANDQVTLDTKFVLDTVQPKLTAVTSTPGGNTYENDGVYYTGAFDVTFTFADANYDSQKVAVNTEIDPTGDDPEGTVDIVDDLTSATKKVSVSNVGADGNTIRAAHTVYTISMTATDKAGNPLASDVEGLAAVNGGVTLPDRIMDNVAPAMDIKYSTYTGPERYDGVAYYNKDLGVSFEVNDASLDAYELLYSLSLAGDAVQGETAVRFAQKNDADRFDTTYTLDKTIAVESDHTADGTYVYTVEGKDKAGNALVVESEYYENGVQVFDPKEEAKATPYTGASNAMDTVAPTATMSYTELSSTNVYELENGIYAYYNKDFEATFTFEDTYGTAGNSYGLDQKLLFYEKYLNGNPPESHKLGDGSEGVDAAEAEASYKVTAEAGVENDDYTFAAYGTDKAGNALVVYEPDKNGKLHVVENPDNVSYQSSYHKVLDTKAPTYTLALSEPTNDLSIAVDSNNRAYHNETISATFTVEDVNLDNGRVKADVLGKTGTDFNYETADVEWDNLELAQGQMVNDGSLTLGPIEATADGVYRFQIQGEDRAGNPVVPASSEANKQEYQKAVSVGEGKYWTYPQVRDTLAPVLTVNLNDGADFYTATLGEASEQDSRYYNVTQNMPYRSASSATGTLTKADCSPTSVVYSIDSTTQSQSISGSPYNYENLSLNFSGEQIFSIQTLSIADRAGNTSTMPAKTNKIYLDATAPDVDELAPTVSIAAKESGEGRSVAGTDLFNTGVTVRATVTDPGEGVRSSGLYQVYYKVLVNGDDWTDKVGVSGKGVVGQAGVLGYGTGGSEFVSDGSDQPITSQDVIDFSFDAETFNYNDVKIYVWAEDNAGNELTEAQAAHYYFGIDVTTPTIEVSYDNNNAQNEKYFKEDRVATVVVTERNFDPSNTTITTETSNISGWTYAAGSLPNGDDDTWTCTVSYTEDGDYTFDVTTTDLVGHKAEEADYGDSVAPKEFTIDKTAPVIQISFNNNDVRNGKYYDAARTATISIEEHNFSADGATVTTTANIQEGSVAAPAPSGWSSNGDTNTATVPFNEDGNYTMHVEFVDLAGNEAEPEDVDEFVVDTTAPELEITGVEDHMAYNGDVAPIITYHDINYDASSAVVAIQGVKHPDGENLNGTRTEDAFGGSFVCDNIEAVKANDDVYTATGSVSDMAGNETEVQVVFSVNRFGSTYMIADETQPLLDNYYTNTPQDLHVIEINVDSQVSNRVTTSLNGEVNTLQEGTDYTVAESVPGWHQYDYTILAANFTTEGIYDVTLSSEDEAGNTSSNRAVKEDDGETSDLPITFVVDMTPPVNVITGVDNDEQYIAVERTIVVNYDDNIGMAGMTLYVNDEKVAEYDGEDLQNAAGSIQYTAKAANRWQSFKVVSTDLAGNTSEESTVRYLLTDNLLVQYFNNKPIFYGSLAILAALIVLIIVFIKRKKQQPVNKA